MPFSTELNQILIQRNKANAKNNVMKVVDQYSPNGHPIRESLMYAILEAYPSITFTDPERRKVINWIRRLANAQMNFVNTNSTPHNNFLAHQIKTVALAGDVLSNNTFIKWAETRMRSFIDNALYPDGSCLDFKERDSLTYVTYTLNALLIAVPPLEKRTKINYYTYESPQKSSIQKSVHWLIPYIEGSKQNLMFLQSIYSSDSKTLHADKHGKPWDKADARQLLLKCVTYDTVIKDILTKHY